MTAAHPDDQSPASLAESLARRFRTAESTVDVGGRTIRILHPASAEDLIDEREFERDERLPYWAELWPSSQILAGALLGAKSGGRTLLELGCGSGLVATCASLAGFRVTATDYYEDALRFARVNAWRNGAPLFGTLALDWRALPARREPFDVVIASDVLYERPYGALVAAAIDAFLARDGRAYVADPGRVAREAFLASCAGVGLVVDTCTDVPFEIGPIHQTISVFELYRRDE